MAATNPNLNNVNLMGPNQALSPELQAEQSQLQIKQEIAQALMGTALQDYSPIIHTGGSNPFARDIPNIAGPIGEIADALMGRAMMNKVGGAQRDLAQRYQEANSSQQSAVMRELTGYDLGVPGPDGSTPAHVPGNALRAASVPSTIPAVQQLKDTILKAFIENQAKQTPTGGDILQSGRNLDPRTVGDSLTPGLFGTTIDPSKLVPKATITMASDGSVGNTLPLDGAITKGSGILRRPPEPIIPAGGTISTDAPPGSVPQPGVPSAATTAPLNTPDSPVGVDTSKSTNNTGADLTRDPTGKITVMETPATKASEAMNTEHLKTLEEGREDSQAYMDMKPKLLKALELIPQSDLKIQGDVLTKARQWAVNLGMSKDDANKIGDTQTFLKTMMSPAVGAARAFNSRATQMEFVQFLKAFAASQDTDPRAATNIVTQMLLDGYNANKLHERNIDTFGKTSIGPQNAESYRVKNFPTIDQLAHDFDQTGTKTAIMQHADTGLLTDNLATHRGKAEPVTQVQWIMRGGKLIPNPNATTSP